MPALFTVIDCVVSPLLHLLPIVALEVSVTVPPAHIVVGPLAEIVGVESETTTTLVAKELDEVQPVTI